MSSKKKGKGKQFTGQSTRVSGAKVPNKKKAPRSECLKCSGCGAQVPSKSLSEHFDSCEKVKLVCPNCDAKVPQGHFQKHKKTCLRKPLNEDSGGTNGGGGSKEEQKESLPTGCAGRREKTKSSSPACSLGVRRKKSSRSVINIQDLSTESEMSNSNHTIISANHLEPQAPLSLTLGPMIFPPQDIPLNRKSATPLQLAVPREGAPLLNSILVPSSTPSISNSPLVGNAASYSFNGNNHNAVLAVNTMNVEENLGANTAAGANSVSNQGPSAGNINPGGPIVEEITFERSRPAHVLGEGERSEAASTSRIGSYFGMETASLYDASGSNRSRLTFETNIPGVFSFFGQDGEGNIYSYSFSNNNSRNITFNQTNNNTNSQNAGQANGISTNNNGNNNNNAVAPGPPLFPQSGVLNAEGGATHSLRLGVISQLDNNSNQGLFGGAAIFGTPIPRLGQAVQPDSFGINNNVLQLNMGPSSTQSLNSPPRGLLQREINRIPSTIYNERASRDRNKKPEREQTVCIICLCEFEYGQRLRNLSCSHKFHTECLDNWLKISGSCPICKRNLSN